MSTRTKSLFAVAYGLHIAWIILLLLVSSAPAGAKEEKTVEVKPYRHALGVFLPLLEAAGFRVEIAREVIAQSLNDATDNAFDHLYPARLYMYVLKKNGVITVHLNIVHQWTWPPFVGSLAGRVRAAYS